MSIHGTFLHFKSHRDPVQSRERLMNTSLPTGSWNWMKLPHPKKCLVCRADLWIRLKSALIIFVPAWAHTGLHFWATWQNGKELTGFHAAGTSVSDVSAPKRSPVLYKWHPIDLWALFTVANTGNHYVDTLPTVSTASMWNVINMNTWFMDRFKNNGFL